MCLPFVVVALFVHQLDIKTHKVYIFFSWKLELGLQSIHMFVDKLQCMLWKYVEQKNLVMILLVVHRNIQCSE
jgi:hypothetical protein